MPSSGSRTIPTSLLENFGRSDVSSAEKQLNGTATPHSKFFPSSHESPALSQRWPSSQRENVAPASSSATEVIDLTGDDSYEIPEIGSHQPNVVESARHIQQSSPQRTEPRTEPKYALKSLEGINSQDLGGTTRSPSRVSPLQSEVKDDYHPDPRLREQANIGVSSELQRVETRTPDVSKRPIPWEQRGTPSARRNEKISSRQSRLSPRRQTGSPRTLLSESSSRSKENSQKRTTARDQSLSAVGQTASPKSLQHSRNDIRKMPGSPRPRLKLNGPKGDPPKQQRLTQAGYTVPFKNMRTSCVNQINTVDSSRRVRRDHDDILGFPLDEPEQALSTESESDDANVRMQRSIYQVTALYNKEPEVETQERFGEEQRDPIVPQQTGNEIAQIPQQSKPPSALGSPELGERLSAVHETEDIDRLPESVSEPEGYGAAFGLHSKRLAALDDVSRSLVLTPVESTQRTTDDGGFEQHTTSHEPLNESAHHPNGHGNVLPGMKILESIFKPLVEEMRADQEYLIAGILSRARKDAIEHPGPKLDLSLSDPFAAATISNAQPGTFNPLRRVRMESRVVNARMKPPPIESQAIAFKSEAQRLPKYNSIVRLGSNLLALNDKDLRYLPYFPSEEDKDGEETANHKRREELLEGFDNRIKFLPEERKCAEQAEFWREHVGYFLEEAGCTCVDVMFYLLHDEDAEWKPKCQLSEEALLQWQKREMCCGTCGTKFEGDHWDRLSVALSEQKPDEVTLALAGLVCSVFRKMANFSIWHIVSTDAAVQSLLNEMEKKWSKEQEPRALQSESLCMVCHTFDCPTHGAYLEDDSHDSSEDVSDSRNREADSESGSESSHGPESRNNIRQTVALPERPSPREQQHRCGFYCVDPETRCLDILSRQGNGDVKGEYNRTKGKEPGNPGFADDEFCSESCFWEGDNRPDLSVADIVHLKHLARFVGWSQKDLTLYNAMLATCIQVKRGPCIMATMLARPCAEIFPEILVDIHIVPHPISEAETSKAHTSSTALVNGYKDKHYWFESSQTYDHHKRSPFVPCSHSGSCHKNPDCTCWTNKVACEWICGCDRACSRRFQGCRCIARGAKVCFKDPNCDCWVLNRECDPWLCGKCGVLEVLDPVNRHDESVLKGRCKNGMIQRNVPKRTLKSPSEVHGWGLFAGTDIRANDFIGEYKGEVISEEESNRRGLVYHYRGLEYLFRLNRDQEIDSSRAGNKMRFINNSERPSTINVYAQTMLCNGVQRIGLFAKRNLVAGEEMFFRYGYPESVTKNFWEKEDIEAAAGLDNDDELTEASGNMHTTAKSARAAVMATKLKKALPNRNIKGKRHAYFLDDLAADGDGDNIEPSTSTHRPIPKPYLSASKKRKRLSSSPIIDETTFDLPEDEPVTDSSDPEGEEKGRLTTSSSRLLNSSIGPRRTEIAESDTNDDGDDDDQEYYEDEDEDDDPSDEEEEDEEDPSASDHNSDIDISDDANLIPTTSSRRIPSSRQQESNVSASQRARNLQKTAAARAASLLSRRQKKKLGASKSVEGGGVGVGDNARARAVKSVPALAPAPGTGSLLGPGGGVGAATVAATGVSNTTTSSSTASPAESKSKKKETTTKRGGSGSGSGRGGAGSGSVYRGAKRGRPVGWKKGIDFK